MEKAWFQSRYDKARPGRRRRRLHQLRAGQGAVSRLRRRAARRARRPSSRSGRASTPYFEGCLPIEVMAARGVDTLRFGPMKPVGLTDPRSGRRPYAVVQLRQDNALGTLYNMVGFQTKLKYGEQARIFRMIPGLERAEFARLGGLHRNTFLNSPRLLDRPAAPEGRCRGCASPARSPASRAMSRAPPSDCWPGASPRPSARATAANRRRRPRRWARCSPTSPAAPTPRASSR